MLTQKMIVCMLKVSQSAFHFKNYKVTVEESKIFSNQLNVTNMDFAYQIMETSNGEYALYQHTIDLEADDAESLTLVGYYPAEEIFSAILNYM